MSADVTSHNNPNMDSVCFYTDTLCFFKLVNYSFECCFILVLVVVVVVVVEKDVSAKTTIKIIKVQVHPASFRMNVPYKSDKEAC